MYNIIVATHGQMAAGMKQSLEFVMGMETAVKAICLDEEGITKFAENAEKAVEELGEEELLVFVDFTFGSPFNEFSKLAAKCNGAYEILTGVNLPALVEAVSGQLQGLTLEEAIPQIRDAVKMGSFRELMLEKEESDEDE